jgi:hypothetical protein
METLAAPNLSLMDASTPRVVTSVLVEEREGTVVVTWGLGEPAGVGSYFGYEVYYYGPDGNGGKRLGVRFAEKITPHVWDNASSTQANYVADAVEVLADSIVVTYRDADIGLPEVGTIAAVAHIDGRDMQTDLPVSLLR